MSAAKGYFFMLVACVAYGTRTAVFLGPNRLVAGGVSGLAILLNMFNGKITVGMLVILLNVPILLLGVKFCGWKFIVKCLLTILCLGVITDLLAFVPKIADTPMLAALYGGVCQGVGIGLFVRYEFSSGGKDSKN